MDNKTREGLIEVYQKLFGGTKIETSEFLSHMTTALERRIYFLNHPEEKQLVLDKARELLEEWKNAKMDLDRLNQQIKQEQYTLEISKKRSYQVDLVSEKARMFSMFAASCPIEEMMPLLLETIQ